MQHMNRLLLIAITIVVLGIAAISIVLLGSTVDREQRTEDILTDLSDGKYEVVWLASSPEFRARYPLERFSRLMQDFHGNLGAFQRVLSARTSGPAGEATGPHAEDGMAFEVEYANGQAFCYIVLDVDVAPPRLQELLLRKTARTTPSGEK